MNTRRKFLSLLGLGAVAAPLAAKAAAELSQAPAVTHVERNIIPILDWSHRPSEINESARSTMAAHAFFLRQHA